MTGRTSPILSPHRNKSKASLHGEANGDDDDDGDTFRYSPMSSPGNRTPDRSALQIHKDMGFYASPTSSTRSGFYNDRVSTESLSQSSPPPYTSPTNPKRSSSRQENTSSYRNRNEHKHSGDESKYQDTGSSDDAKSLISQESKYSSLMEYLDTEIAGPVVPPERTVAQAKYTQPHHESDVPEEERLGMSTYGEESTLDGVDISQHADDITAVSSMSLSPSKPHRVREMHNPSRVDMRHTRGVYDPIGSSATTSGSRKGYIWENFDDYGAGAGAGAGADIYTTSYSDSRNDDASTTYFSLQAERSVPNSQNGAHSSSSTADSVTSTATSLETIVTQVKSKVNAITDELRKTNKRAADLQVELTRVHTARKRRLLKFKKEWEAQLDSQREEQNSANKRAKQFVNKLESDIKGLEMKIRNLEEKSKKLEQNHNHQLDLAREELDRQSRRARRQWDAEEKAVFEKALNAKLESMRKDAAASFSPQLEKMVEDGKIAVREKEDECQLRAERLRHKLASELHEKMERAKAELHDEYRVEEEKHRRAEERKLEEALRLQQQEVQHLKESYSRERRILEEQVERARRNNAEVVLDGMKNLRSNENQQISDLMSTQQRELSKLLSSNAEQLKNLNDVLTERNKEHEDNFKRALQDAFDEKLNKSQNAAKRKAAAETERVLNRLRDDVKDEREKTKRAIDTEIDDLRATTHTHLEALQVAEKRSIERAATLRSEIAMLNTELSENRKNLKAARSELQSKQEMVSELREELHTLEHESKMTEQTLDEEKVQTRLRQQQEILDLEEDELKAKEELSLAEINHANKQDDARAMYAADITRIRDKVGTLLSRKDNTARDMRRQLQLLQEQSSELQDKLDKFRAEKYAGSDSMDFDAQDGRSILEKLNIGNVNIGTGRRAAGAGSDDKSAPMSSRNRKNAHHT